MKLEKTYKHPNNGEYFNFETNNKIVVLLGPNGAGKTTMLKSFKEQLDIDYEVIMDNPQDIDESVLIKQVFELDHMSHRFTSEGERMSYSIGKILKNIGSAVRLNKPTVVLFDRLDSGLSYDRLTELINTVVDYVVDDVKFIVITANSYELCYLLKDVAKFYWVPTNEWIELPEFKEFVKMYL